MLEERLSPDEPATILELGAGTGYLAMRIAAGAVRGTRVLATDVPERMKNLKYNLNRNQLRHAVRPYAWDWNEEELPDLDWQAITHCIASDVVYYDESRGMGAALAAALAAVLSRCRAGVEVLLMLQVRILERHAGAEGSSTNSTLVPSDSYDERSSVFAFVEHALPAAGLQAVLLARPHDTNGGLRLYKIERRPAPRAAAGLARAAAAPMTAPTAMGAAARGAMARELQTAWSRQRAIWNPCSS